MLEPRQVYTLCLSLSSHMTDSPAASASNRRLTARTACRLTVRYRAKNDWHPSTAMDLSRGGCRIRLGEDLSRGSKLTVAFETPLKDGARSLAVEVAGRVMWCRLEGLSYQAGILFENAPDGLDDILTGIG